MSGRIPRQFIDELLSRIDIVDVVQQRVPLKKKGKDFMACCPFHNEKTPSFSVSQSKQFYYCFGCGASGSAIHFLMTYDHRDFVDTVEELAASVNLTIPRNEDDAQYIAKQKLYDVMQQASTFYKQQLREPEESNKAVEYLKQRGVSGEIAQQYDIGFAPAGWDALLKALTATAAGTKTLEDAGLILPNQRDGYYDRFRDRIMFPIRDSRGRVIAFGGRTLGDDNAKYLNSPETAIFHKSQTLYGLYEARKINRQLSSLLVVEGYMDVVALAQFGITNAVATLGTATNEQHLTQLFRATSDIIFCFDGDLAGQKAAWRALKNSLAFMQDGRQIRFLFLPDGEDPDSYVRKQGTEHFKQIIAQATPFSVFFFDKLCENIDMDTIDGRSVLANRAEALLNTVPHGIFHQLMLDQLAKLTGYKSKSLSTLSDSANNRANIGTNNRTDNRATKVNSRHSSRISPVRDAIRLLLEHPRLWEGVDLNKLNKLDLAGVPLLRDLISTVKENPDITCGAILERWRDTEHGPHLIKLANLPMHFEDEEQMQKLFHDTINFFHKRQIDQQIQTLLDVASLRKLDESESKELTQLLNINQVQV